MYERILTIFKCFKALFIAPGAANESVAKISVRSAITTFRIDKISVAMIAYTAVQVRFKCLF